MKNKRVLVGLALSIMLVLQSPLAALAADASTPTDPGSTTNQTVDPTPAPAPTPDPTPAPAPDPAPANPTPPTDPAPTTGPSQPTGKAPDYAFNDATRHWEPTIISSFTWDSSSGLWVSPFYTYDSVVGWYHVKPNVTPSDAINALTAGSADPASLMRDILGFSDPSNSNTGPNSTNNSTLNNHNNLLATLINNASINNFDVSTAASGNTSVSGNTSGGNSNTGAATVVKNLLNLLNAMWSWSSGGFSYFIDNIFGHHTGDLTINTPGVTGGGGSVGSLPACSGGLASNSTTGPGSHNTATSNCTTNVNVNSQNNGSITNNVDILAKSGNANVGGNTNGGNAISGDATAELNIVNLINTAIGADQTFFGIINIYGDMDGDILFPGLNLGKGIASSGGGASVSNTNTGPSSTNNTAATDNNNVGITNHTTDTFNNNIQAQATSGAANVSGNTEAGSATTGDAATNSSLFNLFDTSVFGDNAVLVIVNDMGHWVGQILNLGGDGSLGGLLLSDDAVVSNDNTGPNSTNNATVNNTNNVALNNTSNGTINNNVHVVAQSGDANVSGNTIGGNAQSGNAKVASNVANIGGSHLSLRKIFGILIINVFGSWTGSVGIDTAAGNAAADLVSSNNSSAPAVVSNLAAGLGGASSGATSNTVSGSTTSNITGAAGPTNASIQNQLKAEQATAAAGTKTTATTFIIAALAMLFAGALFGVERKLRTKTR